jgi:hypothetical protein
MRSFAGSVVGALGLVAALAGALAVGAAGPSAPPVATVRATGPEETVFAWAHAACETWDVPDTAARAVRSADSTVRLFASHDETRAMVGGSLDDVAHRCDIAFEGGHDDDPRDWNDRSWISGLFTRDGKRIWALVHAEFQGFRRPDLCPSRQPMRCWRNAVTLAVSDDGGRTFKAPPEGRLVATPPYPYEGDIGRHVGYFNPTGMVEMDGWIYAMFTATAYRDQQAGARVMRTRDPDDPRSWRAWGGSAFDVAFADPYRDRIAAPRDHVCAPVGVGQLMGSLGGLVRLGEDGPFVVMMAGIRNGRSGFWASASRDLVQWSAPTLVRETPITPKASPCPAQYAYYPSLLDPASRDPSLGTIGPRAYLYFTRTRMRGCEATPDRDLIRVPVEVTVD